MNGGTGALTGVAGPTIGQFVVLRFTVPIHHTKPLYNPLDDGFTNNGEATNYVA